MNPKLFKSAEFYQRRYHNFATLLIVPLVLLLSFLIIFSLFAQKKSPSHREERLHQLKSSLQFNQLAITP